MSIPGQGNPPPILEARQLVRRFGNRTAVAEVSFAVRPGESVGFLGPNGAGKTTTFNLLTGLLRPDSGEVLVGGAPIVSDTDPVKRRLGLVPQDLALYDELDARRNLRFFAALQGGVPAGIEDAVGRALDFVGLADRAGDRVGGYSGGMKRRLNLAAALLHDPDVLLLDEPTVGVDPQSRNAIFENILALRRRGKTLLYTTHYMEEVERLCDRVVVVDHGRVVADDTLERLRRRPGALATLRIRLGSPPAEGLVEALRSIPGIQAVEIEKSVLDLGVSDPVRAGAEVLGFLSGRGVPVLSYSAEPPNLETVFLELTGRSLRDG